VSACEVDEETCDSRASWIASESVAVRIARATIAGATERSVTFKINPTCTRRGKWRLRVAPRLINRPPLGGYGSRVRRKGK